MNVHPIRRRRDASITLVHAARLHQLVMLLSGGAIPREEAMKGLGIGLRTFYRDLERLERLGIRVRRGERGYALVTTPQQAEARLPVPDPQFSFAEMNELARTPGAAGRRLARLLSSVTQHPAEGHGPARGASR